MSSSSSDILHSDDDEEEEEEFWDQYILNNPLYRRLEQLVSELQTEMTRKDMLRDRPAAHKRLMKDYFVENPVWGPSVFRRRFRMQKSLFMRIVNALEAHDPYFQQRANAKGGKGFSALQKCTSAITQLAYGGPADQFDEYPRISECIAIKCLRHFCRGVIEVFGRWYLRKPTVDNQQRLMQMHEQRHGFPGMLGSLDCMHWAWKNCHDAWKKQFTGGDDGVQTIILEAVASQDMWIWHAFFGVDAKRQKFKQMQEAAKKDVERAFGVLQARWTMIKGPKLLWYRENFTDIIYACIILHNMIVEDEGEMASEWIEERSSATPESTEEINQDATREFDRYINRGVNLRDKNIHHQLQNDLVEHIWNHFGVDE